MGILDRFKRRATEPTSSNAGRNPLAGNPVYVFRPTAEQVGDALADWQWLLDCKQYDVVLATAWGDLFLVDHARTNTWFLSTENGKLEDLSLHPDDLGAALKTPVAKEVLLKAELAMLMQIEIPGEASGPLQPGYVLSLGIPMVLGGDMTRDNIDVVSLETHLIFQGQIHNQMQGVPMGTVIKDVVSDPDTRRVQLVFG